MVHALPVFSPLLPFILPTYLHNCRLPYPILLHNHSSLSFLNTLTPKAEAVPATSTPRAMNLNLHAADRVEGATHVVAVVSSAIDGLPGGNDQTSTQGKIGMEGLIKTHRTRLTH